MRALMIGVVAVALAAAGGASFFANRLITLSTQQSAEAAAAKPAPVLTPMVLVAAQDVAAGAPVTEAAFRWQPWPADSLRPEYAAITPDAANPDATRADAQARLLDMLARRAIAAGEPLTEAKLFRRDGAGFLAGALAAGHRAVAIAVEAESAASGFILPGDRVDVILSQDARRHLDKDMPQALPGDVPVVRFTAETVVENVRVLAIDQTMRTEEKESAHVAKTVTLEVTPEQVERLAIAQHMGRISLTLRSLEPEPVQMADAEGEVAVIGRAAANQWSGDLQVSPSLAAILKPAPAAPPPGVQAVAAGQPWTVIIHRAGSGEATVRGEPAGTGAAAPAAPVPADGVTVNLTIPERTLREEPGSLKGLAGTIRGPAMPATAIRYGADGTVSVH